jgi:hypothetical protein
VVHADAAVGDGDPDRAVVAGARDADVDPAAALARVDAVADGVLDQREDAERQELDAVEAGGDVDRELSRSGIRICISSR